MTTSKAQQLWARFAEMFGAEVLAKRYGDEPPVSWMDMINDMPDYKLQRGMRRLVHSGRESPPTLPAFMKLCEAVGGEGEYAGDLVGFDSPRIAQRQWSRWEIEGNTKLLAYVRSNAHLFSDSHHDGISLWPGPLTKLRTHILVAFKNSWAQDMEEADKGQGVPREQQLTAWQDCMQRARETMP